MSNNIINQENNLSINTNNQESLYYISNPSVPSVPSVYNSKNITSHNENKKTENEFFENQKRFIIPISDYISKKNDHSNMSSSHHQIRTNEDTSRSQRMLLKEFKIEENFERNEKTNREEKENQNEGETKNENLNLIGKYADYKSVVSRIRRIFNNKSKLNNSNKYCQKERGKEKNWMVYKKTKKNTNNLDVKLHDFHEDINKTTRISNINKNYNDSYKESEMNEEIAIKENNNTQQKHEKIGKLSKKNDQIYEKFNKHNLQEAYYQVAKKIKIKPQISISFIERNRLYTKEKEEKFKKIEKNVKKIIPKIDNNRQIDTFNRLINDTNRRYDFYKNKDEILHKINKNFPSQSHDSFSPEQWKEIYNNRFFSHIKIKDETIRLVNEYNQKLKYEEEEEIIKSVPKRLASKNEIERIGNRLYSEASKRKIKLEEMRREKEKNELKKEEEERRTIKEKVNVKSERKKERYNDAYDSRTNSEYIVIRTDPETRLENESVFIEKKTNYQNQNQIKEGKVENSTNNSTYNKKNEEKVNKINTKRNINNNKECYYKEIRLKKGMKKEGKIMNLVPNDPEEMMNRIFSILEKK